MKLKRFYKKKLVFKKTFIHCVVYPLIGVSFLLTGCKANEPEEISYNEEEISVVKNFVQDKEKYSLYVEKDGIELGKYEPDEGIYAGAYIMSNSMLDYDIKQFEKATDKSHAMYMNNFSLGDPFPEIWILDCLANLKTPNLVIKPPNNYNTFNDTYLIKAAKDLGTYNIPIFVHFYPNPSIKNYDKDEYVEFFKKAYNIFEQYAPKVAMVFSVGKNEVGDFKAYYPGDEYVDWVGLNIYQIADDSDPSNLYGNDVFDIVDYFYYTFQETKPLMISQLAISYYTEKNNVYYEKEASAEISRIYNEVKEFYPRIKGIIYMDFTGDGYFADSFKSDNFSITENKTVLKTYKNTVDISHFLSNIVEENKNSLTTMLMKSPFASYKIDNRFYISKKSISFDTDILEIRSPKEERITIDGEVYYSSSVIVQSGEKQVMIDENNRKAVLVKAKP